MIAIIAIRMLDKIQIQTQDLESVEEFDSLIKEVRTWKCGVVWAHLLDKDTGKLISSTEHARQKRYEFALKQLLTNSSLNEHQRLIVTEALE